MDHLRDYGDLGALVMAGFSSTKASHSSLPSITGTLCNSSSSSLICPLLEEKSDISPVYRDSSFHGSRSLLSCGFASALEYSLPASPVPSQFSLPQLSVGLYEASVAAQPPGFLHSVDLGPVHSTSSGSAFLPSLSSASFQNLDPANSSGRNVLSSGNATHFADAASETCSFTSAMPSTLQRGLCMPDQLRSNGLFPSQPALPPSLFQKILAEEEPVEAAARVATMSSSSAQASEMRRALMKPNFSRSLLRSLVVEQEPAALYDKPATAPPTRRGASNGAEKRAVETELSSSASNKGRGAKRRKLLQKRVVHVPAVGAVSSKPSAGENVPSDMWAWRKYGQKPIKGSPHPRGYYRCSSSKGCPARKQVERNLNDPLMLVVTYTADHNHPWPTHRMNALAGSIRPPLAKALPSTRTNELSPDCNTSNSPLSFDIDELPDASPLSHDDIHWDEDFAKCQDFDAADFDTTSPTFATTSTPLVTCNVPDEGIRRASNKTKLDPEVMGQGDVLSSRCTTSTPSMLDWVVSTDASRDLRSLLAPFGSLVTSFCAAGQPTCSLSVAPRMAYDGFGAGNLFSALHASSLDCDVASLDTKASMCSSTTITSSMAVRDKVEEYTYGQGAQAIVKDCSVGVASKGKGRGVSSCVEEEAQAQLFDTLLGEMLEEVQNQNREGEGSEDQALLFNWSNNNSLLSQVNHLVQ